MISTQKTAANARLLSSGESQSWAFCVYAAIHRASGRRYVGYTKNFAGRRKKHEQDARSGSQKYFHNALRKHGTDAFDWEIIAFRDNEKAAKEAEIYYIAFFRSHVDQGCGYNCTEGGDDSPMHNPRTAKKVSEKLKGRPSPQKGQPSHPNTAAASRATGDKRRGKPAHPNTAAALRANNKATADKRRGKPLAKEQRVKISATMKARCLPASAAQQAYYNRGKS